MALSKEQLKSNNEMNTEAIGTIITKTDIAKGNDLKFNKTLQSKNYRQRNKTNNSQASQEML